MTVSFLSKIKTSLPNQVVFSARRGEGYVLWIYLFCFHVSSPWHTQVFFLAVFADLHAPANPVYCTIRVDRDGHRDHCSQHYCMILLGKIKLKYLEEIKKYLFR